MSDSYWNVGHHEWPEDVGCGKVWTKRRREVCQLALNVIVLTLDSYLNYITFNLFLHHTRVRIKIPSTNAQA